MLYCSNPNCSNPFSIDGSKFCLSCGSQTLSLLFRNRYRVIRLLGEGGFGRTYQAIDTDRMDDPCVVKQFVPQVQGIAAHEKATELFKQEAQRLYELGEHPQIPRLIAYFEQDKRLYLVQELIEGETLLAELQQQGSVTVKNIEEFPCEDLRTIDKLWVKYSNGRFGFSVQKRIWQDAQQNLETFGGRVGWRNEGWFNSSWKVYYSLTFTRNAPLGHLPAQGVTVGRDWDKSLLLLHPFFSLVNTCGL